MKRFFYAAAGKKSLSSHLRNVNYLFGPKNQCNFSSAPNFRVVLYANAFDIGKFLGFQIAQNFAYFWRKTTIPLG